MSRLERTSFFVAALFTVIFIIGAAIYFYGFGGGALENPAISHRPRHAAAGTIVEGFPLSFLLGYSPTAASDSYSILYASDTAQYTAVWRVSATPRETCSKYRTYFAQNDWQIDNQADYGMICSLYARTANAEATVAASTERNSSSTKVVATYVRDSQ